MATHEPESPSPAKASPLAEEHARLGARMASFAGWSMPIQYEGILPEHRATRQHCGVFDISHMGQLRVSGPRAAAALNRLLTNDAAALASGQGHYTLLLNEAGGVIDDLLLYREAEDEFLLVVNAAKAEEDRAWIAARLAGGVQLRDESPDRGGLAVQGPEAARVWQAMAPHGPPLPPRNGLARDGALALCRTGYTGEDGFELFAPAGEITGWFRRALDSGAVPCGLGARDTLRLEKCYPLNGADLSPDRTPLEAGLGAFVKLDKPGGFLGSEALARQQAAGIPCRLSAIRQTGKGAPPRSGYAVHLPGAGEALAVLTSGSLSPTLGQGIALAYLPAALSRPGTDLEIEARGRRAAAEVTRKPFV